MCVCVHRAEDIVSWFNRKSIDSNLCLVFYQTTQNDTNVHNTPPTVHAPTQCRFRFMIWETNKHTFRSM